MLFHGSEDVVCTEYDISKMTDEVENLTITSYIGKHLMRFAVLKTDYLHNIESFLVKQ